MEQSIKISFRSLEELRDELNTRDNAELASATLNNDQPTVVLIVKRSSLTGNMRFAIMDD